MRKTFSADSRFLARLAVRILGEVTPERVALLQDADEIVVAEIRAAGLYSKSGRASPCCCRDERRRHGDQRTYAYTRPSAVHSEDGMTADWTPLPTKSSSASAAACERVGINRVVYDITSKPPAPLNGVRTGRPANLPSATLRVFN